MSYKLVRDKIPQIIREKGEPVILAEIPDVLRLPEIITKMMEELKEARAEVPAELDRSKAVPDRLIQECADFEEAYLAYRRQISSWGMELLIEEARKKKEQEKGGFIKYVMLELPDVQGPH